VVEAPLSTIGEEASKEAVEESDLPGSTGTTTTLDDNVFPSLDDAVAPKDAPQE